MKTTPYYDDHVIYVFSLQVPKAHNRPENPKRFHERTHINYETTQLPYLKHQVAYNKCIIFVFIFHQIFVLSLAQVRQYL